MSWEVETRTPRKQYKKVPATPRRTGSESSDVDLIRACKLWDKITTKMHNEEYVMPEELEHAGTNQPYSSGDYKPLQCKIQGKFAELTVGSSTGHKAKVDLERKTIDYFDTDSAPNQAMNDLFEEAGLECKIDSGIDGVSCTGVTKENVSEVFKVLAMPTSMDFRIGHCKRSKVSAEDECESQVENTTLEDLGYREPPSGCDCSGFWEQYKQDCIDNFDYSEYSDSDEDCVETEKRFFREGPKKESLTKAEAKIIPSSQKKITEFERRRR